MWLSTHRTQDRASLGWKYHLGTHEHYDTSYMAMCAGCDKGIQSKDTIKEKNREYYSQISNHRLFRDHKWQKELYQLWRMKISRLISM